MAAKVKVKFDFKPTRAVKRVAKTMGRNVEIAIGKESVLTAGDIKRRMSEKKSGRFYRSRASKARHQASAPGQAPAVDTGAYRGAVGFEVVKSKLTPGGVVGRIGLTRASKKGKSSLKDRLPALEFGSKDGKTKKRPVWGPAYKRAIVRLRKRLKGLGR